MGKELSKHVFVTKLVGNRFHELSLGRNVPLDMGISKIEVLAKQSKKKQRKHKNKKYPSETLTKPFVVFVEDQ